MWRHPNIGFWSQYHCWSKGGDNPHQWKLELRFLKSVSLADQKVETPWSKGVLCQGSRQLLNVQKLFLPRHTTTLGFWSQCHLLIKRQRQPKCHLLIKRWRQPLTPQWKLESRFLKLVSLADQKVETSLKRQRHPNLGFWSQCHLLIKRQRHPDQKVETPWSKGVDTQT